MALPVVLTQPEERERREAEEPVGTLFQPHRPRWLEDWARAVAEQMIRRKFDPEGIFVVEPTELPDG